MSTPNTVKEQLQNLIGVANEITGKNDTDLTGAVNSLVDARESIIDNSVTEIYSKVKGFNRDYALAYLSNLRKIRFPFLSKVDKNAFRYCRALTDVFIPNVLSLGNEAFYYCDKLEYLDLPKLTTINTGAFNYDSLFETLILRNTNSVVTLSDANALNKTLIASGTGYIYVPKVLIESYKTATNWVIYDSQFRALEDYTVDGTIDGELDWDKVNGGTA